MERQRGLMALVYFAPSNMFWGRTLKWIIARVSGSGWFPEHGLRIVN